MATSVGFIGVGNMGNPMAGNVLKAFPLTVFDKNPNAMSSLIAVGAQEGGSAQEVLERAEIVMTCLPASPDVEALYLDAGGLVERAKPGTILIDLSSVLPSTPRKIEPRATQRGVHFLEAPVSGGDRKSTRLNSSHITISYAVFCLKKKKKKKKQKTYNKKKTNNTNSIDT